MVLIQSFHPALFWLNTFTCPGFTNKLVKLSTIMKPTIWKTCIFVSWSQYKSYARCTSLRMSKQNITSCCDVYCMENYRTDDASQRLVTIKQCLLMNYLQNIFEVCSVDQKDSPWDDNNKSIFKDVADGRISALLNGFVLDRFGMYPVLYHSMAAECALLYRQIAVETGIAVCAVTSG